MFKKRLFSCVTLVFLCGLVLVCPVNASSEMWNHTYGGAGNDKAKAVIQTNDEGYAIAGYTDSVGPGNGNYYFWIVKTDKYGNMIWNRTYVESFSGQASSLVQTSDGGYAVGGGTGYSDFLLVKTDSNGNLEWNQTYGDSSFEFATCLVQTPDGGYALAGCKGFSATGFQSLDFWLVKTDMYGNMMWNKTIGRSARDSANSLIQVSDGGYALAGFSGSPYLLGLSDFWLVKTDSSGNVEWDCSFGETDSNEEIYSLVETSDKGFALAGFTDSFGAGGNDFWLVKVDRTGDVEWNRTYGGVSYDDGYSLVETSNGGFALAGSTLSFGEGDADFWLVKTDADGNVLWNQTYGGENYDIAYSLVQASDGGFALAGFLFLSHFRARIAVLLSPWQLMLRVPPIT
jgi:hypothetical protein